ncbi:BON domain-containing protein [Burkholderia sp. Ac-20353]|nr:BON domain-containing protein [Burkholderia sp. Ac-20353]
MLYVDSRQGHIRTLVKHGKVALAGTVPVSAQIGKAGAAAASVPGVAGVDNRLVVAVKSH